MRIVRNDAYALHEIRSASGTMIREYVNASGTVFAVAWDGPWLPDLRQVLGEHFDHYQAAMRARQRARGPRRAGRIDEPGLVVQMSGHPARVHRTRLRPGAAAGRPPARVDPVARMMPLAAARCSSSSRPPRRHAARASRRPRSDGDAADEFSVDRRQRRTGEQLLQRRVHQVTSACPASSARRSTAFSSTPDRAGCASSSARSRCRCRSRPTSSGAPIAECFSVPRRLHLGTGAVGRHQAGRRDRRAPCPCRSSARRGFGLSRRRARAPGAAENTLDALGANGVLGVGLFRQDCGSACVSLGSSNPGFYYSCPSSGCAPYRSR